MRTFCALVVCVTATSFAWGFSAYASGDVLPEATLTGLDGKPRPYLGKQKVNVFFFFRADQKHSALALKELAEIEKEFATAPVAMVGLVSSTTDLTAVRKLVADSAFTSPVLVDEGDALYGKLGTALTPVVGLADEHHKLLAYLPFLKLNYEDSIRAWVRFSLGELTQEQLQAVLTPPPSTDGGPLQVARRYFNLAQKQYKGGNAEGALASLKRSLSKSDQLADAHALQGLILASQGNCPAALASLTLALSLEPGNELAVAGQAACATQSAAPADAGQPPDAGSPPRRETPQSESTPSP